MGVFEVEGFADGTLAVAIAVAQNQAPPSLAAATRSPPSGDFWRGRSHRPHLYRRRCSLALLEAPNFLASKPS